MPHRRGKHGEEGGGIACSKPVEGLFGHAQQTSSVESLKAECREVGYDLVARFGIPGMRAGEATC